MSNWISTWGQAHTCTRFMGQTYKDSTARLSVVSKLTGEKIRLRLSDRDGKKPIRIKRATVRVGDGAFIDVSFSGSEGVEIPVGGELYSDEIAVPVHRSDVLTVSMAFTGAVTSGNGIREIVHASQKGDHTHIPQFDTVHLSRNAAYHDMLQPIPAVSSIEVLSSENTGCVVCFGDSITQQSNWTKPLGNMLDCPVINKGIGGNRLLFGPMMRFLDMYGRAGAERFERDVLEEAGAKAVILSIGTNDLGMGRSEKKPDWVTAERLGQAYVELCERAKNRGLLVYATTILPRGGTTGYLESQEAERVKFNEWLRTCGCFDGVADFDTALRDAERTDIMAMAYDSGDHLHPGPLGGQKLAAIVYEMLKTTGKVAESS